MEGDDRWIPEVKGEDGKPSLQSINEVVRQIFTNLQTLEGRLGEVSIRDSLRSLGDLTTERRLEVLSLDEEPDVSDEGEVALYYDETDGEFKVSEDGGAWETFLPAATTSPTESWSIICTGTNVANSITTALSYTSENFDTDNQHDNGVNPSRVTFVTAGKYIIGATVVFPQEGLSPAGTGYRDVSIWKNGGSVVGNIQVQSSNAGETILTMSALGDFIVGDYVEIKVTQTSGETLTVTSNPFWGHRLS